ncbi:MAG: hypothetical protein Q7J32_18645 [Sphingomonadaceae bacterium]|nr:hypothetical protein [Sphingomonadaceae bacterium]
MKRRLVILSVPYLRVTRVLLSPTLLDALGADADIVVVGPFAAAAEFKAQFEGRGIDFLECAPRSLLPQPYRFIYALSELMRMFGFWFRHRDAGLGYYWQAEQIEFGDEGADRPKSLARRWLQRLTGVIGRSRGAWKLLDRVVARRLYDDPALRARMAAAAEITLVQASSWGFQDRMLASLASRAGARMILLPYTTDQLWVNGHLLADYDVVAVQGPFEERCARAYHDVPDARIEMLGSLWFRTVDSILERGLVTTDRPAGAARRVLYAGVSRRYFPRESEYLALHALLDAQRDGRLPAFDLVYRPYAMDEAERRDIEQRVTGIGPIELQWPEDVCAGLDDAAAGLIEPQLVQYLGRLASADVVVMSHTTSLGWDAAYLGSGVVANFADPSGVLARRGTQLRFLPGVGLDCSPQLPVAQELDELVSLVGRQLGSREAALSAGRGIVDDWDHRHPALAEALRAAVFGRGAGPDVRPRLTAPTPAMVGVLS